MLQQAEAAETALQQLLAHPQGESPGPTPERLDGAPVRLPDGTTAAACNGCPRGYWRDFAYRPSHGRNHQFVKAAPGTGGVVAQSITTSSPPNGDRNTNDTIDILEECSPRLPVCCPDKSVIWMLWASERPRSRCSRLEYQPAVQALLAR